MSALAIFGICVAIIVAILALALLLLGSGFFMIIAIIPVVIAEGITGQRGTFSPNGSSRKGPMFAPIVMVFVIVQVLVLAAIPFGLYCLIAGWPTAAPVAEVPLQSLSELQLYRLQIINMLLGALAGLFIVMMIFNMIRFQEQIKKMPPYSIALNYIVPLVMYPLAFVFLVASHNYLSHYADGTGSIPTLARACGIIYVCYLIFTTGQQVYVYISHLQRVVSQLGFQYWFSMVTSLFYKVLFIYFVIRIFTYS